MSADTRETMTLWVCVDCNGEIGDPDHTPDREPWGLITDEDEVTMGLLYEAHGCDDAENSGGWCGCEQLTFSWTPCDACGSTLGGAREAYTLWPVRRIGDLP